MVESYKFLAVWRYVVKAGCESEFEQVYGPKGDWAQLFSRHEGYIKTELMRSGKTSGEYMTIDSWRSADAFNEFAEANRAEYEELDRRCAELTESEKLVGYFLAEGKTGEIE